MNFYQEFLSHAPLFTSDKRVSSLDYLEPSFRASVEAIIAESAALGTPLMVFETYRSPQRQEALFEQGATQLKTVGVHHFGLACDIVKDVNGEPSWKGSFNLLGRLASKHGLVWGGSWTGFVDAAHVQRIAVKDQSRLFAGWWPDPGYVVV